MDGGVQVTNGILCGLDPLSCLVHVAHLRFGGDNNVAFDLLGRETVQTFYIPAINGVGEGGCRVIETGMIKFIRWFVLEHL